MGAENSGDQNRRPIQARSSAWAQAVASLLARSSITPNQISVASVFFAVGGAMSLLYATPLLGVVACAVLIQLRLICNLLDGMVAVEGGKKSALGGLYNEFPDRLADSVLIVALGLAAGVCWLGWFGALVAALTAYIRVFGGSLGFAQDFRGPMAKQHRMAVMTVACLVAAIEQWVAVPHYALLVASIVIAAGSVLTCITRTLAIVQQLESR